MCPGWALLLESSPRQEKGLGRLMLSNGGPWALGPRGFRNALLRICDGLVNPVGPPGRNLVHRPTWSWCSVAPEAIRISWSLQSWSWDS